MNTTSADAVYFLLVDDLPENLLSLNALLQRDGLILPNAKSGPEALELLLQHDVALALLDVQMPGMDGFELAELMRGIERTRHVPIIFLTAGTSDVQRRFRGYEAGAVDFLQKPIEADILRSKSDVFFELYRQRQQVARQRDELKVAAEENLRLLNESRAAAAALKEADRRKDEFLATLAHELRNPPAPIRNGLQILRMSSNNDASYDVREMMERQLGHLVRLIDDLLDMSRVSQGKIDLRTAPVTLESIVQAACEVSQPMVEEKHHTLTVDLPPKALWLEADLTRLSQVISNLLNNAAKYTPEGGAIHLTAQEAGKTLELVVSDNGIGIPEIMLPKVFELFTQVDNSIEQSQGGLGIGLALVQQLVTMHGGTIRAESGGSEQGSRFIITLPLIDAPQEHAAATDASLDQPTAEQGLRVLVVDDNIPSAQTTGWMLEMIGHSPFLTHDGLEALAIARAERPDVILLDIGLPGMNGYDVCRELRKDPAFAHTLLIAQTGWGQEKDRREATEAGFDHHLVKPVNFEQFSELLAHVKRTPQKS